MKPGLSLFSAMIAVIGMGLESHAGALQLPGDLNLLVNKAVSPAAADCADPKAPKVASVTPDASTFATDQMVKAAYPYYNKPYANDPTELTTQGGITIYRPNHGLAHAVRSAALSADLAQMILADPAGGDMQTWLKAKIKADPDFMKKMAMMALLHRSGRQDEADSKSGPPEKRMKEMNDSANNFRAAAAQSGLKFTPAELDNFANAIISDGDGAANVDQDHLSRLLRCAHTVELIRDGMALSSQLPGYVPEINASEIKKIYQNEDNYLKITGDQRQAGGGYTAAFYQLSSNPSALLQAVAAARKTNAQTPAPASP